MNKIPNIITESEIGSRLHTQWMGHKICFLNEVDSTNEEAKRLALAGAPSGTVVAAEEQLNGKGRRGHQWISPSGQSAYFTILLRPEMEASHASMLTLVAALAVAKGIEEVSGLHASIKWPNDLVLHGKKICGILTEMSTDMEYINYVVIGIGININTPSFAKEINDIATSLMIEAEHEISRAGIIAKVIEAMEHCYEIFMETQDMTGLMSEYNSRLVNVGREVKIVKKDSEMVRKAVGIDDAGGLIVEDETGTRQIIISGEVSVRGLFGYV